MKINKSAQDSLMNICVQHSGWLQPTLGGGRQFCPKIHPWKINKIPEYLPKKLIKFRNFTWYMPKKLTKCPNFTWFLPEKKYFSGFFWGGQLSPCPHLLRLWLQHAISSQTFTFSCPVNAANWAARLDQTNDTWTFASLFNPKGIEKTQNKFKKPLSMCLLLLWLFNRTVRQVCSLLVI